jgi:hypothetical protein
MQFINDEGLVLENVGEHRVGDIERDGPKQGP